MATIITPSKYFRNNLVQSMKSKSKNRFQTAVHSVINETSKKGDRFANVVSQARVQNFLAKHPEQRNFMSPFKKRQLEAAAKDAERLAAKKAQEKEAVSQMIKYYNGQARLPKYLQRERTLSQMLRDAGYHNATGKFRHFGGYKKKSHKRKRQSKNKKILRSHKKSKSSKNKK